MTNPETAPRMTTIQTADTTDLGRCPIVVHDEKSASEAGQWVEREAKKDFPVAHPEFIELPAKDLAEAVVESMEYDIGYHVLVFNYGVAPEAVKRMDRAIVREWGRGGFPKQTHCHECGQLLPDDE